MATATEHKHYRASGDAREIKRQNEALIQLLLKAAGADGQKGFVVANLSLTQGNDPASDTNHRLYSQLPTVNNFSFCSYPLVPAKLVGDETTWEKNWQIWERNAKHLMEEELLSGNSLHISLPEGAHGKDERNPTPWPAQNRKLRAFAKIVRKYADESQKSDWHRHYHLNFQEMTAESYTHMIEDLARLAVDHLRTSSAMDVLNQTPAANEGDRQEAASQIQLSIRTIEDDLCEALGKEPGTRRAIGAIQHTATALRQEVDRKCPAPHAARGA